MKEKIESVKLIYLTIFFDLDIFRFFGTLNKMHRNTITKFVISREFMVVKHIISFKNIRLIYEKFFLAIFFQLPTILSSTCY